MDCANALVARDTTDLITQRMIRKLERQNSARAFHGGNSLETSGAALVGPARLEEVLVADVLDAWFAPAPAVLERLEKARAAQCKYSPPSYPDALCGVIGDRRGLDPAGIVVGAGSSSLMFSLLPQICRANDRVLLLSPSYGEYPHVLGALIGAQVDVLELSETDGFRVDPDVLRQALARGNYKLVVLVNPNNPTGTLLTRETIVDLSRWFPETMFLVDEAYIDYCGIEESCEAVVGCVANIIVFKSLSKVYALSGLRAAYAATNRGLAERFRPHVPPWALSWPAQVAALAALESAPYYQARYDQTRLLREALAAAVEAFAGVGRAHRGAGNFIFLELAADRDALQIAAKLADQNIFIRSCASMGPRFAQSFLRLAVRSRQENATLLRALCGFLA